MRSPYLTKSDFKACFDCRTRLYYRKNKYSSNQDENEYLRFLADGGFMIETVAKARYPSKNDLVNERDAVRAFARTIDLLNAGDEAVVYEAAALHGKYQARIDILRRQGGVLELIEVKSSSINVDENEAYSPFLNRDGEILGKWREYLLDVTFQLHVARLAFPQFEILPRLCVVNKAAAVGPNETMEHFRLFRRNTNDPKARPEVEYTGDLAALRESSFLVVRPVDREAALLMPEVVAKAESLASLLGSDGQVARQPESVASLYKTCRLCEYRFSPDRAPQNHGFAECWGQLASAQPHILDLHRVGQIGTSKQPDPVPGLLERGQASLLDLREDQLGAEGSLSRRRHIQWSHHQGGGSEFLPVALQRELAEHQQTPGWPLHFLDFEACDIALPHHAGLRPYERVAFQWSCHTLDQTGKLTHGEWLNTRLEFPNFKFARSLRDRLGETGTVYVWSPYEQATLRRVLIQIGEWLQRDPLEAVRVAGLGSRAELDDLAGWIDRLLGPEDENGKRPASPRIRDLHKLALEHYFHPEMLGRTSIKVVLPAVWRQSSALREHPWFAEYLRLDEKGAPLDPYKTLPEFPLGDANGETDAVTDGTGAIRVYQDLLFRHEEDPGFRQNREKALLQYCKLDTAAMLMIWRHWTAGAKEVPGASSAWTLQTKPETALSPHAPIPRETPTGMA